MTAGNGRAAWLTLAAALACAPAADDPAGSEAIVRDSAGITIVETADLSRVDTLAWSVDSLPVLVIGVTDGEAPYLFSSIAGVARLEDGRIVVADALADEVRFFDGFGRFLHAVGGPGEGPTEYRNITLMDRIAGDSLVVVDAEPPRVTVLTPTGEVARRFLVGVRDGAGEANFGMIMHAFTDGTLLSQETLSRAMTAARVLELDMRLLRVSQDGDRRATYVESQHTVQFTNPSITRDDRPPADPPPRWVAGQDHLYYAARPDSLDIMRFAADGSIDRIFRVPGYVPPRALEAERNSQVGEDQPASGLSLAMVEDVTGHLWVRTTTGSAEPTRWIVFDAAGEPRYGLRIPAAVSNQLSYGPTIEIGEDYLLVATHNASDAPVVAMYRLRKR